MLVKRGECSGTVTLSRSLYRCAACGHADIDPSGDTGSRTCSACGASMTLVSHSAEVPEEDRSRTSGE